QIETNGDDLQHGLERVAPERRGVVPSRQLRIGERDLYAVPPFQLRDNVPKLRVVEDKLTIRPRQNSLDWLRMKDNWLTGGRKTRDVTSEQCDGTLRITLCAPERHCPLGNDNAHGMVILVRSYTEGCS